MKSISGVVGEVDGISHEINDVRGLPAKFTRTSDDGSCGSHTQSEPSLAKAGLPVVAAVDGGTKTVDQRLEWPSGTEAPPDQAEPSVGWGSNGTCARLEWSGTAEVGKTIFKEASHTILKSFRHPVMFSARSALPCNLPLNPCAIHRANSEGPREQPREEGGDTTGVGDDPPRYHTEKRHGLSLCVVRSSCSPGDQGLFRQDSL